jgi:hypothetical protein
VTDVLADKWAEHQVQITALSNQMVVVMKNQAQILSGASMNPPLTMMPTPAKPPMDGATQSTLRKAESLDIRQQLQYKK